MRAALILFVLLVLLVLGGCSTAVHGDGRLDTKLHCATGAVTDRSAPFCFARPSGFHNDTADVTARTYCGRWSYCTLVALAQHDLIQVLAAREPFDADTYSDAKLRAEAESGLHQVSVASKSTLTDVSAARVGGVRAYQQTVLTSNGVTERAILAFRGHTELFVQCDWLAHAQTVQTGCDRVLGSLQIVPLS